MGIGPFAYVPFIIVFLKTNDAAYDTRQSVHKTMGVLTYMYIVINMAMGGNIWLVDLAVFGLTTFFFYRAMSENFENTSVPALAVVALFGALSVYVGMPEPGAKDPITGKIEAATAQDKEMQKTLKQAQQALEKIQQSQQQNADLMK